MSMKIAEKVTAYRIDSYNNENTIVEFFHLDGSKTKQELTDSQLDDMAEMFESSPEAIDLIF